MSPLANAAGAINSSNPTNIQVHKELIIKFTCKPPVSFISFLSVSAIIPPKIMHIANFKGRIDDNAYLYGPVFHS